MAARPAGMHVHDLVVLGRYRGRQARNMLDQQLREAPVRTFAVILLLVVIWGALYFLLETIFYHVGRWGLVAVVANKHIFVHFFLVLAVMLAFSNAILAFGNLFGRDEAAHLLTLPAHPRQVLTLKWFEGMLLSSWSFLVLGVPLMLAVANNTTVEWYYYPLFIGHFLGFVLVPATFGLIVAWVVAMWVPRQPLVVVGWIGAVLMVLSGYYVWTYFHPQLESEQWLTLLFREMRLAKSLLLPSTWTSQGIVAAIERDVGSSLVYLLVVLANAAFFSWLTINLIALTWPEAYSRARHGYQPAVARRAWLTGALCEVLFFYLPARLRTLMRKDLHGFVRDATQWTQMLIMLGLLVVYALNLKRLPVDLESPGIKALIAFLNLTTISLILATFTSRFVYPLLSLESQQIWLLGLLPTGRSTLLLSKFIFALTITGLCGLGVMSLAVTVLDLPRSWAGLNLLLCLGICIGLSGLSVGLGARFPVLGQRNPARIASGFGGTLNLIASMLFVAVHLIAVALVGTSELRGDAFRYAGGLAQQTWSVAVGLMVFSSLAAAAALWLGARHFERLEA